MTKKEEQKNKTTILLDHKDYAKQRVPRATKETVKETVKEVKNKK